MTKDKIENNYTDYNATGKYHIRVCQSGKMVTVSGEVFGTGSIGYLEDIQLPRPYGYEAGSSELLANAVVFIARNQSNGAYKQMRVGGDFKIYLEADMTSGTVYAFSFSYCKA